MLTSITKCFSKNNPNADKITDETIDFKTDVLVVDTPESLAKYRDELIHDIKALIDEKMILDDHLVKHRKQVNDDINKLAMQCAIDTKEYEHTFHQAREDQRSEIAKLEANKESLKSEINSYSEMLDRMKLSTNDLIDSKNNEIARQQQTIAHLTNTIQKMTEKQA